MKGVKDCTGELPMDLLTARDTILWYQEIELYADDLGDEGDVSYTVRVRIMPKCFYVLARLELHVVNVLRRQIDTRWLYVHGTDELVREWSWREISQEGIKSRGSERRQKYPVLSRLGHMDLKHRCFHRFPLQRS